MSLALHRIEAAAFAGWGWETHPGPRHRFDSFTGAHRVRYASTTPLGAARERYRDTGKVVPADHAQHQWTRLTGEVALRDLRRDRVLDALGLDARICTAYEAHVRHACWVLSDQVREWWGDDVNGIAYTSRTTPERSTNVALFPSATLEGSSQALTDSPDLITTLTLNGFECPLPLPCRHRRPLCPHPHHSSEHPAPHPRARSPSRHPPSATGVGGLTSTGAQRAHARLPCTGAG